MVRWEQCASQSAHSSVSCVLVFYRSQIADLVRVYHTTCWDKVHPLIAGGVTGLWFLAVLIASVL